MLNTIRPPLSTSEQIRDQRRDRETMRLLLKLRDDLASGIRKLAPESLLALARQYHPEAETDYQAAAMLGLEAMDALRALAQHGEDVTSLAQAEAARLAPAVAEAARRSLEIPLALEGIGRSLRFMDADINERRDNLRKAGVKPDEVERLISQGDEEHEARRTALNAERTALLAEQEALDKFLQTGNEKHLPEDFSIVEVPRISARDALQNHIETRWAA